MKQCQTVSLILVFCLLVGLYSCFPPPSMTPNGKLISISQGHVGYIRNGRVFDNSGRHVANISGNKMYGDVVCDILNGKDVYYNGEHLAYIVWDSAPQPPKSQPGEGKGEVIGEILKGIFETMGEGAQAVQRESEERERENRQQQIEWERKESERRLRESERRLRELEDYKDRLEFERLRRGDGPLL